MNIEDVENIILFNEINKNIGVCLVLKVLNMRKRRKLYRQRIRKEWVAPWLSQKRRQKFSVYHQLLKELREENPEVYKNFTRMKPADFDWLEEKVTPLIKKEDTHLRKAITSGERLAVTLRFLSTGNSFRDLSYSFRIHPSTIGTIIPETCKAIFEVLKEFIKVPTKKEEWERIAADFENKWNFPNCISCMDGKHCVIDCPDNAGSEFYNYKGSHSIVLLGLVDAAYKFTYIDVGCNGRVSDGGVFANSTISKALEKNSLNIPPPKPLPNREKPIPYVILADDAFPLKTYIIKPYPFRDVALSRRIFNYRLSRARRMVESAFGILASRFRVLRRSMHLSPQKTINVVKCICALHNFLMSSHSSALYFDNGCYDDDVPENQFFNLETMKQKNFTGTAKEVRVEFEEYFCNEGQVPWQTQYV